MKIQPQHIELPGMQAINSLIENHSLMTVRTQEEDKAFGRFESTNKLFFGCIDGQAWQSIVSLQQLGYFDETIPQKNLHITRVSKTSLHEIRIQFDPDLPFHCRITYQKIKYLDKTIDQIKAIKASLIAPIYKK